MEVKIKYCPNCKNDKEETFCHLCGSKMLYRDPDIDIDVEIEGQGSRCISFEEFFEIAKKKGLI